MCISTKGTDLWFVASSNVSSVQLSWSAGNSYTTYFCPDNACPFYNNMDYLQLVISILPNLHLFYWIVSLLKFFRSKIYQFSTLGFMHKLVLGSTGQAIHWYRHWKPRTLSFALNYFGYFLKCGCFLTFTAHKNLFPNIFCNH